MSEELNLNVAQMRRRRGQDHDCRPNPPENGQRFHARDPFESGTHRVTGTGAPWTAPASGFEPAPAPVNLWFLAEILARRWSWLLLAAGVCGLLALLIGLRITKETATVTLIRRENPNAFTAGGGEGGAPQAYLSRELSAQTLFGLMRSPVVFQRASEKATPPVLPDRLAKAFKVVPERNADFVTLALSGKESKQVLADWANVCADEVVQYTKELQASEAGTISDFLRLKVKGVERELAELTTAMVRFSDSAQSLDVDKEVEAYVNKLVEIETKLDTARIDRDSYDARIQDFRKALVEPTSGNDQWQAAQEELLRLRGRGYTDLHPEVVRQKALVESLAKGAAGSGDTVGSRMQVGTFANTVRFEILQLQSLKQVRDRELQEYQALKERLQDKAKRLSKTAIEYAQLKAGQKRLEDLRITLLSKQQEAQLLRDNALGYFKVHAYASPEQVSSRKRWLVIGLLSGVGGLLGLLAAGGLVFVAHAIDSRLKTAADVEGVTGLPVLASLGDLREMTPEEQINWAFRTLTILQGKLNSSSDQTLVCGFISSGHGEGRSTWINLLVSAASQRGMRVLTVATRPSSAAEEMPEYAPKDPAMLPAGPATTLTKSVLAFPAQVTEQFNDPHAQPIVHIPLPGWVWNLERRQQWRTAIDHWQDIDNLVLLVELPPACQPESVLLAEHLPQVIWLVGSGLPEIEETRAQLETLRHARCNLVGTVLNREPASKVRRRFARWSRRFSALLLGGSLWAINASAAAPQAAAPQAPLTNGSFSISSPVQRAAWQQRLTLGPGDSINITVFGRPELSRTNIVVGPDGRLNYLYLQGLSAAGLTVDELRSRLDTELARYYLTPRTIVVPISFRSKKYYVLGTVVNEGVFVLDRPLTILEAVARAKGLRTGTPRGEPAAMADLSRSFVVRQGRKIPVDLRKLFHEGDLSQNIPLEPNDYLYFAPAASQEIYVLGEILTPGPLSVGADISLVPALSARGGFTEKAWQKRVLVVRGSMHQPQAYAVDAPAILAGRTPDFKLQPGDIVYVNARPWHRIEELLDIAVQAFIEASVTAWVGGNVPAVFERPALPQL